MERILCPNHEWMNLNPFRVLDIPNPHVSMDIISRRYKALSLLLHPDKIMLPKEHEHEQEKWKEKAMQAFDYVREAMNALKDEDKLRHVRALMDQGFKTGKKEYDASFVSSSSSSHSKDHEQYQRGLEEYQQKTIVKIFAQIEQERRDVERRKRKNEQRERAQEDDEVKKVQRDLEFDKKWREESRMENRMGNWLQFQKSGKK